MKKKLRIAVLAATAVMALVSCERFGVSDRKGDASFYKIKEGQQAETFQIALIDDPDNEFVPYEDSGCMLIFLGDNEKTKKELGWLKENKASSMEGWMGMKERMDHVQNEWGVKIYWTMPGKSAKEIQEFLLPYVPEAKIFLDNPKKENKRLYNRFFLMEDYPDNVMLTKKGELFNNGGGHLFLDSQYDPNHKTDYEKVWTRWQYENR